MEQIEELLGILKGTPQMAIWGLAIWCLYILLKLSSVVYAVKVILQLAINKWHDLKVKETEIKKSEAHDEINKERLELSAQKIRLDRDKTDFDQTKKIYSQHYKRFNKLKITDLDLDDFNRLMDELVGLDTNNSSYIHGCDIKKAIELAKKHKASRGK